MFSILPKWYNTKYFNCETKKYKYCFGTKRRNIKMGLTLKDVFNKIYKRFFDENQWFAVRVNNDIRIYKREGWQQNFTKELIIMFPMAFLMPEGFHDYDVQFRNTQKFNPTVQGKIKDQNHGDKTFFLKMLTTITIDLQNNNIHTLEKHLVDLIENSIKLSKYSSKEKYDKETIPYEKIQAIKCDKGELLHYLNLIQKLIMKNYANELNDSNMYFKDKLNSDNVCQCLSFILYKCLLDMDFAKKETREDLRTNLQYFECALSTHNSVSTQNNLPLSNSNIKFYTCSEFKDITKQTYEQIAKHLLENDKKNFGDIGEHSGTISQWAQHMALSPEQWGLLILNNQEIIGNYSCVYLNPDQEKLLLNGMLVGNHISAESVVDSGNLKLNGEASLYLMNISVNEEFATFDNWNLLFSKFGSYIRSEIKKGVVIKKIYATSFKTEYALRLKRFGFSHVTKRCGRGDFFQINLYKNLSNCSWFCYPENFPEQNFIFRKMNQNDLHNETILRDIATLIHLNDEFIYEQGMMTLEQAQKIIPSLFSKNDSMFNVDNIFLSVSRINNRVVGVILSKEGKLNWDSKKLKEIALFYGITLKRTLDQVETQYFKRYDKVDAHTISIINSNVHPNMKLLYTTNLEDAMIQDFIKNSTKDMLLYVLCQAEREFDIYSRNGFELEDTLPAFTINNNEFLPSALLYRKVEK